MTDRRREISFALAVLIGVLAVGAVGELAARQIISQREARETDWAGLRKAVAVDKPGPLEFRPGTSFGQVKINALGLRGPEIAVPKPAGTIRIVFAGDSKLFAAEVRDSDAVAGKAVATLSAQHPQCRFDYANLSGPGYTLPQITRKLNARLPALQPSVVVLLAGSAGDLLSAEATSLPGTAVAQQPDIAEDGQISAWLAELKLIGLIRKELQLVSPATQPSGAARQPLATLRSRFTVMLEDLDRTIGNRPTVAIAYRGQRVQYEGMAAHWLAGRRLRQRYPGLGPEKAEAIAALVASELRQTAATAGWRHIDPIAGIMADPRYFQDRVHFSPAGHAHVGKGVGDEIGNLIGPDCQITQRGAQAR